MVSFKVFAGWWQRFIDWMFYVRIQRNYPTAGNICGFSEYQIQCIVISNNYGNRAIILQELQYQSAYVVISYGYIKRWWRLWFPWPVWAWAFLNSDGSVQQTYYVKRQCMADSKWPCTTKQIQKMAVMKAIDSFDDFLNSRVLKWFWLDSSILLHEQDWRIEKMKINQAAKAIQVQWRRSISCPLYKLCRCRLVREFDEFATEFCNAPASHRTICQ